MKALFITILLFAAAFAGYDYFLAPPGQKMIFKALNVEAAQPKSAAAMAAKSDAKPDAKNLPPIPQDKPAEAAPKPTTVEDTPPKPTVSVAPPPADPNAFVAPKFEPLESLAKGWTDIPKTAFPRQVTLRRAVPFKMSAGSSTMNAGAQVTALGFEQGTLTLAPAPGSSARAAVALDDTDLKLVLEEGYEQWKVRRLEWLKDAHKKRLAASAAGNAAPAPAGDPAVAPARGSDGSYPLLVSSLTSGLVNEIKLKNVHNWGDAQSTMFEGKPAWSIKIKFDAETVFGPQPTEAQAIVSGGRVKGWFYTGSGEPVP